LQNEEPHRQSTGHGQRNLPVFSADLIIELEIVPATVAHIYDLGWIHAQSWRETYVGQMPASYLAGLDVTKRSLIWAKIIRDLDDKAGVYLIKFSGDRQ
jgi:hypothetical protein